MTPNNDDLRARLHEAGAAFALHRHTAPARELVSLLDALSERYYHDLASVKPERLGYVQGALAQVLALKALLCHDTPHASACV